MVCSNSFEEFNVYYMNNDQSTKSSDQSMYDCLYYYVNSNIANNYMLNNTMNMYGKLNDTISHQNILYCFRPWEKSAKDFLNFSNIRDKNFTFYQLRENNISSDQLYSWSAPINIVEDYEIYLTKKNNSFSDTIYYNCTSLWFGPLCQYRFDFEYHSLSFNDIVRIMYETKEKNSDLLMASSEIISNLSCYLHIKCNRGGPYPACLDWREICDGKIDCIDEGLDEQYCDKLEINECQENEYRCHNGQCISEDFLWDDSRNPDCLDQTDESLQSYVDMFCSYDPAFRCEDVICRPTISEQRKDIVCGDGVCVVNTITCLNKRNIILKNAMIKSKSNLSTLCQTTMICLTGFGQCGTIVDITKYCPELFQFPSIPVLFGHIKFLYSNSYDYISNNYMLPKYVCYDNRLCSFTSTVSINSYSSCLPIEVLSGLLGLTITFWDYFISELKALIYRCAISSDDYCQHNHTLYTCKTVRKCISKHRLIDGIDDCMLKDDERFPTSCLLINKKHRVPCYDRCLSPIMVHNYKDDCLQKEDENSPYIIDINTHIYFQTICDGFTEIFPPFLINKSNYTDETECDLWPCNNIYTRCDGHWNCLNGEDEVNCSSSKCPPLQHMCVSPLNNTFICLPIEKAGDGIVDCLGASDERSLCSNKNFKFFSGQFWCRNDTKCLVSSVLCNSQSQCVYGDDEQFCTSKLKSCWLNSETATDVEIFLCNLATFQKRFFKPLSLDNSKIYPVKVYRNDLTLHSIVSNKKKDFYNRKNIKIDSVLEWVWKCNRGLNIRVWIGNNNFEQKCLCPPSYYGELCQYQNQRVSLTLYIRVSSQWRTIFTIIISLIDDDNDQKINSFDYIEYLPIRDCATKFNLYFLYSIRPKNILKNYSIRIDAFNRDSFEYLSSWLFPIQFPFLPVYRMAKQILIPIQSMTICSLNCGINGRCFKYENTDKYFCHCNPNWSGSQCNISYSCDCAPDSICVGPSICLCPLEKFGPRCYLNRNLCKNNSCMNDGVCVPSDIRISENGISCICKEGFSGPQCEFHDTRIDIKFRGVTIPSIIFIHFIEIFDKKQNNPHSRSTTFKKIGIYQDSITIYRNIPFHIIFTEFNNNSYLTVLQETYTSSTIISTEIIPSHRCLSIQELFNVTFVKWHLIRRIKYYHLPCKQRSDLACFYDDTQICLCNLQRHANCFEFNHTLKYNCQGVNHCENGGNCFEDHPKCPTASVCSCQECFYGSRCQFSTEGFSLSLDIILGYHILSNTTFIDQPLVIKVSAAITMIISLISLTSNILSIMTFQNEEARDAGCGIYILMLSIISLIIIIMFIFKFWFLVFSSMNLFINRFYLQFNCRSVDFLLRVCININDWLTVSVPIERIITIRKGVNFDNLKSKRVAKWIFIFIILFTIGTSIQDPIHRQLIDDEEEQRIWCITKYSSLSKMFNSFTTIFHILIPFTINLFSAISLIILMARQQSKTRKQLSYKQHLRKQFHKHKHLLISSWILVILALPRLVISLLYGCMKSVRNPWLFLTGYFISFIPSALVFVVFVLPSPTYNRIYKETLKRTRRKFCSN